MSKKDFLALCAVFLAVTVLSNAITAKYIEDKMNNNIRMKIEDLNIRTIMEFTELKAQIRQVKTNISYNSSAKEEKWNDVMAPTELAKYLDIELDQVYDIIEDKESGIPYVLIQGAYRFSKNAIDDWMKSRKNINANIN